MLEPSFSRTASGNSAPVQFPPTTARTWTLPNGLEIIVQEDHSAPVASVQAWVETGSIHEDRHLGAGLSHILEHMLFKGTEKRGASEFAQAVQDAGGYINAYTSFDRTVYWIDIPSKGVGTALDLLSDAVLNSTLPPEEYVKEQEVIRREFAMCDDDPDRVASHALFATAYRAHPYRHPVIGHFDVFNRLTREEVMAYYKTRYVPNNMFFVVTGDVDGEKVRAQLAEAFAGHGRQSLPPVYIPPEPRQFGRRENHQEFATELSRLHLTWHVPALTHRDTPALDLLDGVIESQSSLVAKWLAIGFVHGVMNTDNCAISGETIDYGPCAFLDTYDPGRVFSSIDRGGRYAFGKQPRIAIWNVARLAEALLPLLGDDEAKNVRELEKRLERFASLFDEAYGAAMRAKLGLSEAHEGDVELTEEFLNLMATDRVDYTIAFRELAVVVSNDGYQPVSGADERLRRLFASQDGLTRWLSKWSSRMKIETIPHSVRFASMQRANPAFIPRNHRVEEAITAATTGNLAPFERLRLVLARPYEDQPEHADLAEPPGEDQWRYRTFCGT